MSSIFYPNANYAKATKTSSRFTHRGLPMAAYLFWFFRCLTGWGPLDQVDGFHNLPFHTFFYGIKLTEYGSETTNTDEKFRFGVLDYVFIIPALVKLVMYGLALTLSWEEEDAGFKNTTFTLIIIGLVLTTLATIPCIFLNYMVAFGTVLALSPFLIPYRLYKSYQWNKHLEALKKLEIYVTDEIIDNDFEEDVPQEIINVLLKLYDNFDERLQKRTIEGLQLTIRPSTFRFTPVYTIDNQIIFIFSRYKIFSEWEPQGIVIPQQGNKEAIEAIQYLGFYSRTDILKDQKRYMQQLNQQLSHKERRELEKDFTQFEMFFSISQALRLATQDANEGMQKWANSDVPMNLFNQEIAEFVGMAPLDRETTKAHNQLNDCFLRQRRLFEDKSGPDFAESPCSLKIS